MRIAILVVRNFALAMIGCVAMIADDANARLFLQARWTRRKANRRVQRGR